MVQVRASYQLMPDRIKLKSQDLVKRLADTVLHSQVICIKLHMWYNTQRLNYVTLTILLDLGDLTVEP